MAGTNWGRAVAVTRIGVASLLAVTLAVATGGDASYVYAPLVAGG